MSELEERFREYLSKRRPYVKEIAKELGVEEYQIYGLVEMLKKEGYLIDIVKGKIEKIRPEKEAGVYEIPNKLEKLNFIIINTIKII